ncbi:protein FAM13B isoform X1 [Hippoglossus hippoglossus]|uniref:protein FAM13B isoform X1 n=1 Tax=Hippoglossus hippoglossus TaxID=8267 RepID=UPI00148E798C|nr:protein FAM13B isoform X1 [Hippoglossus hippoglossus]XP_034453962.1 protein FAM13B isoform X1 [Hippoglossus hippoglossus]XP_035017064.1 protein FAM13B isoform X1 [Hippoglossus stenolepis]XP_035017065.1 protein FAM13B isoform X1 [Hippoglossus stenolepis]
MRKSVSLLPGNEGGSSASTTRVFGVPLEEVSHTQTISGHEVPALVKHIVEYIEEHGHLDLEGLFLVNGNAERVDWLRQRYDSGEEVELEKEADLASAVSLLRLFLQELPEPVIPTAIQGHILQLHQDYSNEEELCRNLKYLLQQLPQLNYGLLRFLCRFLASVASLQQESWNVGALAAVFGPDIFHLSSEGEDLRDQESVSRVLAELLDNQEGLFDSEDDDVSTTNDYSSINEQITELLDDDKCEAECEELPQDEEEGPASSDSPQHNHTDDSPAASSHLSPISILPTDSAEIIQRTIRAAVEQHFFDLKTSIDHGLSNYDSQGMSPSEPSDEGCHGDEEQQTDPEDTPSDTKGETPLKDSEQQMQQSQTDTQDSLDTDTSPVKSSGMDMDANAVRDAENNINTARQDNQPCDSMDQTTDTVTCQDPSSCRCDQNANTSETNRNHLSPCQPNSGLNPHLQLFPDNQWEASPPSHLHLPPIDFSCMHLQKDGQDPIPAYKSWQDESESGEAQLSPLAGRMVPLPLLPLEEDGEDEEEGEVGQDTSPSSSRSHPHLLARRFLDFGAHSAQRFLQQDSDATSPTKAQRPRRASFGSKEAMRGGDSVTHQLTKKLQHLKKKIKQFEEQFEKERNYKPSHGDKAANPKVLKWMTDLTKIRRQIKGRQHHLLPRSTLRHQALLHSHRRHHAPSSFPSSSSSICPPPHHTLTPPRHPHSGLNSRPFHLNAKHRAESELGPQTRPRSNTLPKSFGSTLDQGTHDAAGDAKDSHPTREETLELIQCRVKGKKQEDGWPDDIKKMTKEQLSCEKTVLQKNLLHYEGLHGRPVTREERLVVRPLYDRYRLVKQMLTRVSITPITVSPSSKRRSQTLQPIIEGETAHFWEEIKEEEEEERKGGGGAEEEEKEEEREEEEDEEEEEEGESSGGEMQGSEVIMAVDLVTPIDRQVRSQDQSDQQSDGPMTAKPEEGSGRLALDLRLSSSNASSMPELLEQLWKTRAEKKKLRKTIREFEEDFYQHNGRNVQKEDRVPMLDEYRAYKRIKAKLRLLEVLISKQDSSKSI